MSHYHALHTCTHNIPHYTCRASVESLEESLRMDAVQAVHAALLLEAAESGNGKPARAIPGSHDRERHLACLFDTVTGSSSETQRAASVCNLVSPSCLCIKEQVYRSSDCANIGVSTGQRPARRASGAVDRALR